MDRTNPLEKEVDVERMKKAGRGMKTLMKIFAALTSQKVRSKMMRKMAEKLGHFYRFEREKDSVSVEVGAHPSSMPVMKHDPERAAEELSSFSHTSRGYVVSTVLAGGVSKKGETLDDESDLTMAFDAGRKLIVNS